jgi:surface antigen
LVTAIGSHTILDPNGGSSRSSVDTSVYDINAVSASFSRMVNGTQHAMLSTGIALYTGCRLVTAKTAQAGKSIGHGSTVVVRGIGYGAVFAARGVGSSIMFTFRIPSMLVSPLTSSRAVAAVIKPADNKKVPIISAEETSAAILARYNAQQQQEIARLQVAQVAANRGLGGSVVTGDYAQGGYPAGWNNTPQDSMLDRWGMYNRECVSYAAWKVYQTFGHMPYWGGVGNANQWIHDAKAAGIPTGSIPQVHSVAISMRGYYGHAMWVEAVNGNMIYVSQYNYDLHGHYNEMWVNGTSFSYIYFR